MRVQWDPPVYQGYFNRHLTEVKQYEVQYNRTDLRNDSVYYHWRNTSGNQTHIWLRHTDQVRLLLSSCNPEGVRATH